MDWTVRSLDLIRIEQGWADFSRVRASFNFFKMLPSTQWRRVSNLYHTQTNSFLNLHIVEDIPLEATRGLLATDHVILNHGQVTWTTPELAPPLLTTTPHQWEDVSALDRFNVHRCPTRRVFSGTGLEPVTKKATVRYLHHSATAATPEARYGMSKEFTSSLVLAIM
ncbi:uncharacterized protein TNCV_2137221 [Trichonephila clavipes]|nr:uncharacterized protein TNCV_2137221 [Trichonephila clavipes]